MNSREKRVVQRRYKSRNHATEIMVEEQASGLKTSETAGEAQWMGTGVRAGGVELLGGLRRHAVFRGEGEYRVPSWPGDDANAIMLRKFVKNMKRYQRSVSKSFGEGFKILAREVILEHMYAKRITPL